MPLSKTNIAVVLLVGFVNYLEWAVVMTSIYPYILSVSIRVLNILLICFLSVSIRMLNILLICFVNLFSLGIKYSHVEYFVNLFCIFKNCQHFRVILPNNEVYSLFLHGVL